MEGTISQEMVLKSETFFSVTKVAAVDVEATLDNTNSDELKKCIF